MQIFFPSAERIAKASWMQFSNWQSALIQRIWRCNQGIDRENQRNRKIERENQLNGPRKRRRHYKRREFEFHLALAAATLRRICEEIDRRNWQEFIRRLGGGGPDNVTQFPIK